MKKSDLIKIATNLYELGFEPAPQLEGKIGPIRDWVIKAIPFIQEDDQFNEGVLETLPFDDLKAFVEKTLGDETVVEEFAKECDMEPDEFKEKIQIGYDIMYAKSGQVEPEESPEESLEEEPEPEPEPEEAVEPEPEPVKSKKQAKPKLKKEKPKKETEATLTKSNLYTALDIVSPALDKSNYIEQSNSFVFKDGYVITFNGEMSIKYPVSGLDVEGAVKADELYKLLAKLKQDELETIIDNNEFVVVAGKIKAGIKMESKIGMPLESIEDRGSWLDLPDDFAFYLNLAVSSCGNNHKFEPILTNIFVEKSGKITGSDKYKIMQCDINTKLPVDDFLIPAEAAKVVAQINPLWISLSNSWVHFKSEDGAEISARILDAKYPEVSKFMEVDGIEVELPENMDEILSRTGIFSKRSDIHSESIDITLKKNEIIIYAENEYGWIQESADINYNDSEITFSIAPYLFKDITKETNVFILGEKLLKFEGSGWQYVSALKQVK